MRSGRLTGTIKQFTWSLSKSNGEKSSRLIPYFHSRRPFTRAPYKPPTLFSSSPVAVPWLRLSQQVPPPPPSPLPPSAASNLTSAPPFFSPSTPNLPLSHSKPSVPPALPPLRPRHLSARFAIFLQMIPEKVLIYW
jgi:hypothetical protein